MIINSRLDEILRSVAKKGEDEEVCVFYIVMFCGHLPVTNSAHTNRNG